MYPIGVLIKDTGIESIAQGLNTLLQDEDLYRNLQQHCLQARQHLNAGSRRRKYCLTCINKLIGSNWAYLHIFVP